MKNRTNKPSPGRPTPQGPRHPGSAAALPGREALNDIPNWIAPLLYAVVTVILFRETILTGTRLLGVDNLELGLFARDFYTEFIQQFHRFPMWQPLLYGGMPFIDGMHGDIFYPPSLALFFMDAETMWGWKMALHIFLAGCFTYIWLRSIQVTRGAALLGGLIYLMSPMLVSMVYPGGDGKLFNYALAPLLFWLAERAAAHRRVRDFAAFSLGVALLVFTSQMQVAYFCIWGVSLYFFFRVFQVWRAGRAGEPGGQGARVLGMLGAFAVAGVVGVAAAAVQFWPPLQYLREWSHRSDNTEQAQTGYDYSTTWSLHPEEIMSLVVPDFVGDNAQTEVRSGATYWGRNPFKLNHEYVGFIPLLLLPLLFIRRRNGQALFFTTLAALALLYALGANTPFFRILYLIPGVSLFRAPSLIIFLYGLSAVTLGALALDRAVAWTGDADSERTVRRTLWIGVAVMGLLALLAAGGLFTSLWRGIFELPGDPQQRAQKLFALEANMQFIKSGFLIIFMIALLATVTWEGFARGLYGARGVIVGLALLAFFDAYRVDRPFVRATVLMNQADDPVRFAPDETIQFLQQRQQAGEVFRVVDLTSVANLEGPRYPANAFALHGLEQLAGHHGNELARYRQLIGSDRPVNLLTSGLKLADVTNTMYLTSPQQINAPGLTEVFQGTRSFVYKMETALPRAFLVSNVEVVPDSQAVGRLLSTGFNARSTAILPEPLPAGVALQPFTSGTVRWLERSNTVQRLQVNVDAPGLLVVLDNYYKAWSAQVDGADAPLLRANHTFRAIPVPAGQHEVTMRYGTETVQLAAFTSGIVLLLLMVLAFGGALMERIRK